MEPEEHQPSGTCNFSRIDNAQLELGANTNGVDIYAVNYNVLRIMSGMGGLAPLEIILYLVLLEFSNYYRNSIEIS